MISPPYSPSLCRALWASSAPLLSLLKKGQGTPLVNRVVVVFQLCQLLAQKAELLGKGVLGLAPCHAIKYKKNTAEWGSWLSLSHNSRKNMQGFSA